MVHFLMLALALAAVLAVPAAADPDRAGTLFVNGNVHPVQGPRAEAIATRDGRILAIGSEVAVRAQCGPETRVIDLHGATVVPGMIDAHVHLCSLGLLLTGRLDLKGTQSFAEVIAAVRERAAQTPAGEWIIGRRWDQADWGEKELPTNAALNEAVPDRPVFLVRVDGHAGIANRKALELAGVGRDTAEPHGGEILRDAAGEPTGVLVDNAMDLLARVLPASGRAGARELLLAAQERCFAVGLTGVHDAGMTPGEAEELLAMGADGALKLRVYAMIAAGERGLAWMESHPPKVGERATVRAIKLVADGALGSRGAWLLAPYSDRPEDEGKPYVGLPVTDPAAIEAAARRAAQAGYQVCTHAIGDRAVRETLDAYQTALGDRRGDLRWRVEHFQVSSLEDIPRLAALGVIASMQPTHATSDMRWAEDRLGTERIRGAYAWARVLRSGARLAFGSDFPVESENPLWGFYAAITRQDHAGRPAGGWRFAEALSREEALRAFTLDAAWAAFEEKEKGSLVPGKLADFTVLSRDVMTCPAEEILKAECVMTVIGGEVVWRKE